MNRITISLIFLIVISPILPASAIMYASGQSTTSDNNAADSGSSSGGGGTTDNSGSSSTGGGTTDNSGSSSTGGGTTDNSGSSSTGGGTTTTTDNSGSSSTGGGTTTTTDNSATLPTTSTLSNNTGNTQGMDVNGILAAHNQERAAVGVPPLTWSDSLAASAQTWADQLLVNGKFEHSICCGAFRNYGESINFAYLHPLQTQSQLAHGWADNEKKLYHAGERVTGDNYQTFGHYTQVVWKNTKEVGCGFASGPGGVYADHGGTEILVCQYSPPGNVIGQAPY